MESGPPCLRRPYNLAVVILPVDNKSNYSALSPADELKNLFQPSNADHIIKAMIIYTQPPSVVVYYSNKHTPLIIALTSLVNTYRDMHSIQTIYALVLAKKLLNART